MRPAHRAELDSLAIDYVVVETGDDQTGRQAILGAVGDRGPLHLHHGHDVVPASAEPSSTRASRMGVLSAAARPMMRAVGGDRPRPAEAAEAGARIGLVIVPDEETGGGLGAERLPRWSP